MAPISDPAPADVVEGVWRRESAHVLGALLRVRPDLADCEDAAQQALEAAVRQWVRDGVPTDPRAWLIRVAARRLADAARSESARTAREERVAAPGAAPAEVPDRDDTLRLLMMCCHPVLTRPTGVALTLASVSGLSTRQVAAAFLVPERTMTQRLSRARTTLRTAGAAFTLPAPAELPERTAAVLDVLYLAFNEGYAASAGDRLLDETLQREALRLVREVGAAFPDHDKAAGLLALLLLTGSRAATRTDGDGDLVPLAEQDRARWDAEAIAEGAGILERVLPRGRVGRFQLEAAIAAVHAEAPTWAETDWPQILVLYSMLAQIAPSPMTALSRAVAVAMVHGPDAGLAAVAEVLDDTALARHHRPYAVRAHLLEMAGDPAAARRDYLRAAGLTASRPEQRYLNARADAVAQLRDPGT